MMFVDFYAEFIKLSCEYFAFFYFFRTAMYSILSHLSYKFPCLWVNFQELFILFVNEIFIHGNCWVSLSGHLQDCWILQFLDMNSFFLSCFAFVFCLAVVVVACIPLGGIEAFCFVSCCCSTLFLLALFWYQVDGSFLGRFFFQISLPRSQNITPVWVHGRLRGLKPYCCLCCSMQSLCVLASLSVHPWLCLEIQG